jgi:hypothetical protein
MREHPATRPATSGRAIEVAAGTAAIGDPRGREFSIVAGLPHRPRWMV